MGRHKIDIKKIPETQQRQVSFSKRRKGLFKKAADICTASKSCSIAIIIFSAAGNLFTFGHPSVDAISRRFLGNKVPIDSNKKPENIFEAGYSHQEESDDVSDTESDDGDKEEVMRKENNRDETVEQEVGQEKEEEEKREQNLDIAEGDQFWWNKPIDNLRLAELRELEESIILLQDKVHDRASFLWVERPLSLCSLHYN